VRLSEKVLQLETMLGFMTQRKKDKLGWTAALDITEIVALAVIAFRCRDKESRSDAVRRMKRLVKLHLGPNLTRLVQARRFVVMVLDKSQCPLTTSNRYITMQNEKFIRALVEITTGLPLAALDDDDVAKLAAVAECDDADSDAEKSAP
jgi:hypothetical protein